MLKSSVQFNYDGGADKQVLPEGCITPKIKSKDDEGPCEKGKDLGRALLADVVQMLGRKLLFHVDAVSGLEPESVDGLSTDRLDELVQRVPELMELIDAILERENARAAIDPVRTDMAENGSKIERFVLQDGRTVTRTTEPGGTVTTLTDLSADGTLKRVDHIDKTAEIIRRDSDGTVLWIQTIQADSRDPRYEHVQILSTGKKPIGVPFTRPKTLPEVHERIEVLEEIYFAVSEATEYFTDTLQEHVTERLKCFLEGVVPNREDYLLFVCGSLDKETVKGHLVHTFQKLMVCRKKVDCSEAENRLLVQIKLYAEFGDSGI